MLDRALLKQVTESYVATLKECGVLKESSTPQLYLTGSFVNGTNDQYSDIDVLIRVSNTDILGIASKETERIKQYKRFECEQIMGKPIMFMLRPESKFLLTHPNGITAEELC